jgi:hypothetical protein
MSGSVPLAAGVGNIVAITVVHPVQVTADVAETVYKVYPGFAGKIIGVQGIGGIYGGTVVATDLDLTFYKSTTALNTTKLAVWNSSTAATGASLTAALAATEAQLQIAATDYLSIDYDITGGTGPTVDGAGAVFFVERH